MSQRPTWFQPVKNFVLIISDILSAGMGLKGFLLSSHFIDRGVTGVSMLLTDVTGGLRQDAHDVLYTVITQLEIGRLKAIINEIDPDAFMIQYGINDVSGGKVKSLPLH